MASGANSRKALEHKIRCAGLVQRWKKQSKAKRCSVAKLASEMGLTRRKTQVLINSRPKEVNVAREKIRFIREAARRVSKPVRRCEVATKLAKDCNVTRLSPSTTQRLRRPYRAKERAIKKTKIEANRERARLSKGSVINHVVLSARFQGW